MYIITNYQINVIRQVPIFLLYYPILSACYYINSKSILQSAHGLIALSGFLYAVIACKYTQFNPAAFWYWPIYLSFLLSIGSTLYSFKAFKGKKIVHIVHGFTLVPNLLTTFVALMAVSHDWI